MKIVVKTLILYLSLVASAHEWNDEETHPSISEFIAKEFFGSEFMEKAIGGLTFFLSPGMSAVLWAQDWDYQKTKPQGDWSWQKVRNYQYDYLTALSKEGEDENLANLLKGLGHQMHLIQDMGQPNHVLEVRS